MSGDMTKQLFWDWSANINTVLVRYVGKPLVCVVSGLFICAMVVPQLNPMGLLRTDLGHHGHPNT